MRHGKKWRVEIDVQAWIRKAEKLIRVEFQAGSSGHWGAWTSMESRTASAESEARACRVSFDPRSRPVWRQPPWQQAVQGMGRRMP